MQGEREREGGGGETHKRSQRYTYKFTIQQFLFRTGFLAVAVHVASIGRDKRKKTLMYMYQGQEGGREGERERTQRRSHRYTYKFTIQQFLFRRRYTGFLAVAVHVASIGRDKREKNVNVHVPRRERERGGGGRERERERENTEKKSQVHI